MTAEPADVTAERLAAESRPTVRRPSREVVGLAGAVLVFVGIATMFAFQQPPFVAPDETAHVGYAHEIADFHLPEITTMANVPASATQWQAERDSARDDRYRGVWVANHPPLNYIVVAPMIWLSDATHRADGGLMFLRLTNIAFAAVGIVLTYLLAVEVTGGARRVGLVAAGLVAFLPQGHALFSQGMNDGLGFAAGTAVVLAATRYLRHGLTRGNAALLGLSGALAFGARGATMLLSVVVVGLVAAAQLATRLPLRERVRGTAIALAAGLGPAVAAFGWFYVRNMVLYGDFGASRYLLDEFGRSRRGTLLEILGSGHIWVDLYHKLLSPSPVFAIKAPPGTNLVAIAAGVGLVAALMRGRIGDRTDGGARSPISRRSLALGGVAVAVVVLTVAQHISGGGSAYARYMFPVLSVMATCVAVGLDRLVPRVLPAIAVALLGYWAWQNVPMLVDPTTIRRPRDGRRAAPDLLQVLPSGPAERAAVVVLAIVGSVVLALALVPGVFKLRPGFLRQKLIRFVPTLPLSPSPRSQVRS